MAFVDRDVASDFTSLAPGDYPNLTGLAFDIDGEGLLSPTYESIQLFEVGSVITVRFFFSAALSPAQESALDAICASHLPTDDEPQPDQVELEDVSTINGVDFDTFALDTNNHVASSSNPHNTNLLNIPSFTLGELNTKLTGANVDDSSDPRTPTDHASSHSSGESDELVVQNLSSGAAPVDQVFRSDGAGGVSLVPLASINSDHGGLTGLGDDDHPQYILVDGSRAFTGDLNAGGNDLTNVGLVDGVDVDAFESTTNAHIANQSNPHLTSVANIVPGTLAQLNGKITDATLDDVGDPRDPTAHASTHEQGGVDELLAQNLGSGAAAAGQVLETDGAGGYALTPLSSITDHGSLGGLGDDDHLQYVPADGSRPFTADADLGSNNITNVGLVDGVDVDVFATNTNAHIADTNNPHGTDLGNIGAGTLAELNAALTDANVDDAGDPRTPTTHASTHVAGGSDPLSHNSLPDLTVGDPHTQYTTEPRARAAAPVQPTSGLPASALGQDGDLAIDPIDTSLYEKSGGTWSNVGALKGDKGDTGFGIGAFARTTSTGAIVDGLGLTVFRVSLGRYRYDFTTPLPNANYAVFGQVYNTSTDTNVEFQTSDLSNTGFFMSVGQGDNGTANDTNVDRDHSVFVVGPDIQGPSGITSAYQSWLAVGNVGTEADFIASLVGPAGPGVPTGGTSGQVLVKQSATDFDTAFQTLAAGDVGADPAGTASSEIADHVNQTINPDPHPQYTTAAEAASAAPIQSVNGDTGPAVSLTTSNVPEGSSLYYTEARVSANVDVAANTAHRGTTGNPHSTTPADIGAIASTEKAAANGVATLDASGKVPTAQIPSSALPSFDVVADIPARDALTAQEGDEAFVTSEGKFYIYDGSAWIERTPTPGTMIGPSSSTDGAVVIFDGTSGQVTRNSTLILDGSNNLNVPGDIILPGTVDGVDVSAQATTTNAHIADTGNPHSTSIANIASGTLAQLNAAVTDATLDDAGDPRDPNAHGSTHHQGGSDEIEVQDLGSGTATPGQIFVADGSGGVDAVDPPTVITDHGSLGGLGDDDHIQYLPLTGARSMSGDLGMDENDIVNVRFVDGVDIAAQALTTNSHIADTNNPHGTSIANLVGGTLAQLNSKLAGATLDDENSPRTPTAHAASHNQGGSDELVVQNLGSGAAAAGLLFQTDGSGGVTTIPTPSVITDHGGLTGLGDDDHPQYTLADGSRAFTGDINAGGNDLTNVGLVDGVDVSVFETNTNSHIGDTSNPHGTDIGNLGGGTLAELNSKITDANVDDAGDPRDPNAHASTHINGGSDPIDADRLRVDYVPTTYDRDTSIAEATNQEDLSAHLAGINSRLVFGQNMVEAESLAPSTDTGGAFQTKLTLSVTTNASNAGRYRLDWSYAWNHNATNNDFLARIRQDGSTDIMTHRQEPKDSGGSGPGGTNQVHRASGFINLTLTTGTFQFDLDYATQTPGIESTIADARLMIYRIS